MADLTKTRERQHMEEIAVGETVWINGQFFDDNQVGYIFLRIIKFTHICKKKHLKTLRNLN